MEIKDVSKIVVKCSYSDLELNLNDYPELRPLVEKLFDYVKKSEENKQNEIKLEIIKRL